jgi:hypothetical protein
MIKGEWPSRVSFGFVFSVLGFTWDLGFGIWSLGFGASQEISAQDR